MKWFKGRTQKQPVEKEPLSTEQEHSQHQELFLQLLRPSILKIFEGSPDKAMIEADAVLTSFGLVDAHGLPKHALERIPILSINESGSLGYANLMRLDLFLCLHQLINSSKTHIDFPLGLFSDRDVIVVTKGLYYVKLLHYDGKDAMESVVNGNEEFLAAKIFYSSSVIDDVARSDLRRLEAMAEHLLTPEPVTQPKLPAELIDEWRHEFLEPIFARVKENLKGNKTVSRGRFV